MARRRFFGLGLTEAPQSGTQQQLTSFSTATFFGGGNLPTSGPPTPSVPYGGVTTPANFLRPQMVTPLPPEGCILEKAALPRGIAVDVTNPVAVLAQLDTATQRRFATAVATWAMKYPQAPAPILVVGVSGNELYGSALSAQQNIAWTLALTRPATLYDPILDSQPLIPPGSQASKIWNAGMRMFFPDYVLNQQTGATFGNTDMGSMTVDGPFPYWVKFVTQPMIELGVEVASRPDAFVPVGQSQPQGPNYVTDALTSGLRVGATTGNPIAAAGGAIASVIIDGFASLFGGPSPPPPPAWLTMLLAMKTLRGDLSGAQGGAPTWSSAHPGIAPPQNPYPCALAIINPPPGAIYTVSDGYLEVVRRLSGGSSIPWYVWAALAAGAGYLLLGNSE